MTNPINIAAWFVNHIDRSAGESITHLKVQKLLYYAQAWHLLALDKPLFEEDIQAWSHGPVVPSVYQAFKNFGWDALPAMDVKEAIAEDSEAILLQVSDIYGEFSAKRLESMTHAEAPWIASRGDLPPEARCEEVMSKDAIKAFFKETYGELEDVKETA